MTLIVLEIKHIIYAELSPSQLQLLIKFQLKMSGFQEKYWTKQMSDVLTVFECESAIWIIKLYDGLWRGTSGHKYLIWTCRTRGVPIRSIFVSNGTYWCELFSPPLQVVIKFLCKVIKVSVLTSYVNVLTNYEIWKQLFPRKFCL